MMNFICSKLYDDVKSITACNYIYKTIQAYEIDLKLIEFAQENRTELLDFKSIKRITGFSNNRIRELFNEPGINIIDISNRLQVTVDDFRSFLITDFNNKGKYWTALKSLDNNEINYSDIIMIFNSFQSLIERYNYELSDYSEQIKELDIAPLDVKQICEETKWSSKLVREKLSDPKLKTIEVSNRIQVDRSVFKEYIKGNLVSA